MLAGDLLSREGERTTRRCDDPAADQDAVTRRELHPTAPLFGSGVEFADGEPGEIEQAVLAESGVAREHMRRPTGLALYGERRVVRFAPGDVEVRALEREGTLVFRFRLPPGCFATTVLGEITKTFLPPI